MDEATEGARLMGEAGERVADALMTTLRGLIEAEAEADPRLKGPRQFGVAVTAVATVMGSMMINATHLGDKGLMTLMLGMFGESEHLAPVFAALKAKLEEME